MRFGISSDYSSCFQINQLDMRQFELQLISERKNWMAAVVRSFFEFTRCKNNSFSQINENKYFMHNIVLVLWNTIREFDFFSRKESCKVFFSTKSILHFKKWFSDMFFRMNRTIKKKHFQCNFTQCAMWMLIIFKLICVHTWKKYFLRLSCNSNKTAVWVWT